MWDAIHAALSVAVVLLTWLILSRDVGRWKLSTSFLLHGSAFVGITVVTALSTGWGPLLMFVCAGVIGGYLSMSYYGNNQASPYSLLSMLVIVSGFSIWFLSFGLVVNDSELEMASLNYFFVAFCQSVATVSISGGMVLFGRVEDMELKRTVSAGQTRWKWIVGGLAVAAFVLIGLMSFLPFKWPFFLTIAAVSWVLGWVLFSSINFESKLSSALAPLLTGLLGLSVALLGVAAGDRVITVIGGLIAGTCFRNFWMQESSLGETLQKLFVRSNSSDSNALRLDTDGDDDANIDASSRSRKRKLPKNVQGTNVENTANQVTHAARILIVPGTGFSAVDASEEFQVFIEYLQKRQKQVAIAVHPFAGRSPGELLQALENTPIELFKKTVESIQSEAMEADLVLVLGANDVVNPELGIVQNTEVSHSQAGTFRPIQLKNAKTVVVVKRSLDNGFANARNPLFVSSNCYLLLGDLPQTIFEIDTALREMTAPIPPVMPES